MNFFTSMLYIWWIMINALYSYAEYDFLSRFTAKKIKMSYLLLYVGIACAFTFIVLIMRMPVFPREIFYAAITYLFVSRAFRCKSSEVITPLAIIISLKTFIEGISAVLMRWIVERITESLLGNLIQLSLSVLLALLFYFTLRYAAHWHKVSASQTISSYLYVLLLPCTFIVWVVRFGFGLDSMDLTNTEFPFSGLPLLWALIAIITAAITFFIILNVFENIMALAYREKEKALLDNQLREHKIYLAEAQKRDEQLRSFQHDINNHLSIISGLLKEKKYGEAEGYFQKLQITSTSLCRTIQTGNSVLDILLREKTGYAEQNHITVSCHVNLPPNLPVDNMDLCIIVSNALDNAIQACLKIKHGQPDIEITIKVRHHFLLIEVTNTAPSMNAPMPGTGLNNIFCAAEKYQGTTEIGTEHGHFRISVLLCLETDRLPDTKQ